jgi:hypothetical protein
MTDLKERFSLADEIGTRELWGEARRRAAAPEAPSRTVDWPPALGRRVAAATVALAVFATAAVFAWETFQGDARPQPGPALEQPPVDLAGELGPGWTEMPPPPEVRSRAATVWTGSQLIVWGGYVFDGGGDRSPADDGFIFDASSRSWSAIPDGPLSSRAGAAFAWTGEELLIWGGWSGECCVSSEAFLADGAAYDPVRGTWRPLPAAPIEARAPFFAWTGDELVVWGSRDRTARYRDGAAYDAESGTWRVIADGPIEVTDGSAVWTGDEMLVFGAALDGNNHAETATDIGATYDPTSDSWRRIADSTLSPQAATAAWPGSGELIAWDYDLASTAYDPRSDAWRDLRRVPLPFSECYPRSVAIPGHVFGDFCGRSVTFSVAEDRWREVTRDELRGWLIEPVAAGSAFLVMGHSLDLSEEPGVAFDTTMLAYVPRTADQPGEVTDPELFEPATETGGNAVRMPVTFPDGSRATLEYPIELELASVGVQPDLSYVWDGYFPIVFIHDPSTSIVPFVEGSEPVATINSYIEIWTARGNDVDRRAWIRVSLPSWTVLVASKSVAAAHGVADSLRIRQSDDGFPVVDAVGPVELAEGFGEAGGAQLAFGDGTAEPNTVSQLDALILLSPDGCTSATNGAWSGGYGSVCLGDGSVFASIYGDREFVTGVIDGLRVEDFRQA